MVDKELLNVLACPSCHGDVIEKDGEIVCQNNNCSLRYPIKDGIPIMLIEEAKK